MITIRLILGILFVCLISSCSQKIIQSTKTIEKDSVHVDSVASQKIIKHKGDSVGMIFKLPSGQIKYPEQTVKQPEEELTFKEEDPIIFKKVQKTGRLTETVAITKKGNVTISCKEDSLQEVIQKQKITIQNFKSKITTETKTVEVEYIPKFYKFCLWWFIATVALSGAYVGLKIKGKIPFV